PAGADRRPEARLVTEDGDLDPRCERRLDEARPLRDRHLDLVDRERDRFGHGRGLTLDMAHAGTSTVGWCVCASLRATIPSSEEPPPNGQPPPSTCATNSARQCFR